jgi:hypothetical protein
VRHVRRGLEFAHVQPPYLQLLDLEAPDNGAPGRQASDRQGADRDGPCCCGSDRERASGNRPDVSRAAI